MKFKNNNESYTLEFLLDGGKVIDRVLEKEDAKRVKKAINIELNYSADKALTHLIKGRGAYRCSNTPFSSINLIEEFIEKAKKKGKVI